MEPKITLPLDILLYIIDLLADGDDIKTLQILSRACKSMVPLCRKHLFSDLLLNELSLERFSDLLSKNPDIAGYVRSLNYRVYNFIDDHELFILDTLKERSSLQSIELLALGRNWNDLPESIRSSLVSLIELPTVTLLTIYCFKGFPATVLSGCSNLVHLHLGTLEMPSPEVNHVISRSKIPTPVSLYIRTNTYDLVALLNSASLHGGGPIVDFSRLQKAFFEVELRSDIDVVYELIKVTTRLESFHIDTSLGVDQPLELAGLGTSLAINAYRTLKLLDISVTIVGDDHDPLCGLSRELRFIAGNNILEELELDVMFQQDISCRIESEDWSAFDSVLTESGAFPMLHRVSVGFWWYIVYRDLSEQRESLKENKFPRLVESKAVDFNCFTDVFC